MATRRTRTIFSHDKVTITVIEDLEFRADRTDHTRHVTASLQPIAVIVREPHKTWALDMDGRPVDIDQLNSLAPSPG